MEQRVVFPCPFIPFQPSVLMESIQQYRIIKKIHERRGMVAYQGEHAESKEPVHIELIPLSRASSPEIARFKHEYQKIRSIDSDAVFETYDIFEHENSIAIVSEPFFGRPLFDRFAPGNMDILSFLKLAAHLSRTLGEIHSHGIVHHCLTPDCILYDPSKERLKLIGFGQYGTIFRISEEIYSPWVVRHILSYMAPEQTGRMNSPVDYRANLYALGVILYELLSGSPPFVSEDPMEIIHAHIARQPVTPEEKNAMVPAVISKIVMKLLSKTLEDRYQSGYGVMADFQECARQFKETRTIRDVVPGRQDRPIGFHMPETLMGREAEIDMLRAAYERTCDGANEMFVVSGAAGIGKSSLIRELQKSLAAGPAYFIEGKAEQYKRNIPYYPIIQAFTDLANQILCESDVRVADCKKKILATFGGNAALLTQLIPQFEHIIGKHHAAAPLDPEASSIRFQLVFREFVKSCASAIHPLVIFIDDLQWADPASLDFLAMLAGESDIRYLLIIGAYHDNDMSASHPLRLSLADVEKKGVPIHSISLPPLTPEHVNRLIARVLYCDPADTTALSEIIFKKSQGNPFYIHQFLKILYEDKILYLDPESGFSWNLAKVADMRVSDNAVDFMALKISRLPDDTRETMRVCACCGNRFDILVVAACHGKTVNDVVADLSPAREEGLVVFAGDAGEFCHDRIKEAVYRLFSEDDRKQTHYAIGRYLLENTAEDPDGENAADIVNHLNIANEWVSSAEEQIRTARLNAQAGEAALASGAFDAAFHYFQTGIQFLRKGCAIWAPTSIWESHYELALSLHTGCANAAYLTLAYGEMERLSEEVIEHARCVNDQVKVHIVRLHALMAQNRLDEVIQYGLAVLNSLGAAFPRKPSKGSILLEMAKTRLAVRGKTTEAFLNLPAITDPTVQAQVDIMATITSTAYWNAPRLLPIILFRLMRTFLSHGNSGFSPYVYAGYGFILCTLGDINKGYRFGQMALSLLSKINAPQYRARTLMVVNTFVRHWKEHAAGEAEPLLDAVNSGMAHGDIEFAGHAMMVHGYTRFLLGAPLGALDDELEKNRNSLRRLGQLSNLNVAGIYHQVVTNAKGMSDDPCALIGSAYDETVMATLHEEANDRTSLMHLYFAKLMLNVFFENSVKACRHARKVMIYIDGGAGSLIYPTAYFLDALAHLARFEKAGSREKRKIVLRVLRIQKRLAQWSAYAPENFLHKVRLVEAETARIKNKDKEAIALYKKALEGALANGYLQEGALAAECLGRFYHLRGIEDFAASFLTRARALYLKWGAHAKVRQMEGKYGGLLEASPGIMTAFSPGDPAPDAAPATGEDRLDMSAIVKMSQAISSEIQLGKLLVTLMRVIIENAGAEKAFLILNRNDRLVIEARADINSGDISAMPSVPIEDSTELCARIVSYVRRTRESLVLDDAQQSSRFAGDSHIRRNQVRSVLCMPLVRQQQLTGVIYLENDLTPHAFTPVRLEMITLLSTQAANCLENAISFEATRAAEKNAQKQREEYQKLIETMNDGLVITDSRLTVMYVNKAICRIFGNSAEALCGRSVMEFLDEANQQKVKVEASKWEELDRHVFEIDAIGKDSECISLIVSPKPIHDEDGNFSGFLAIVTDVTELKKAREEKEAAQAQLILSQKMEAIGTLAGGVAHDFNNYLMIIIGSIDLIEVKGTLPADLEKHLSDIRNAAASSSALTRQLLAFGRRQRLETIRLDINEVVENVEKMLHRLIGENIRLTTGLAPDLKKINADYGQMEQIIMNLAINARDAMPSGGSLHLDTANAVIDDNYCRQVRYAKPGEFVRLTVEDTGGGMDRETVDKIFEPFFSTKAAGKGTGLGLSVVYGVIKQHNGWINVYSEPNRGTTFSIYLPVSEECEDGQEAVEENRDEGGSGPWRGNGERVLLVEDQPEVRDVVTHALETNGYAVTGAETIARAQACMVQQDMHFDLLFSDIVLPDGNGIDFADAYLRSFPNTKVLLSSGYTEKNVRPEMMREKGFCFLQKPYHIQEMLKIIKTMLSE